MMCGVLVKSLVEWLQRSTARIAAGAVGVRRSMEKRRRRLSGPSAETRTFVNKSGRDGGTRSSRVCRDRG